tara:strand:+ start:39 stop:200 length:162 start_codon:yes stop_codon:yes gene_type:complete
MGVEDGKVLGGLDAIKKRKGTPEEKENISKKQRKEKDEEKSEHEENNSRFLTL